MNILSNAKHEIQIIPTNTCPRDFAELETTSLRMAKYAQCVQLDVADGVFVPTVSWPYYHLQQREMETMIAEGLQMPGMPQLQYEAHLMVNDPVQIGAMLAQAGCMRVFGHAETFVDDDAMRATFALWRESGASEVGLALLIDTPLQKIKNVMNECDSLLLMSIASLGAQGAKFDERIFERIEEAKTMYPNTVIAVDGGVSDTNIQGLVRCGATRFGAGSAISKSSDPEQSYGRLLSLAKDAIK